MVLLVGVVVVVLKKQRVVEIRARRKRRSVDALGMAIFLRN